MLIQRAFKVRLYPTPEQADFFNRTLGCCRFLYNQMLDERIQTYQALKDNKEALYTHKYKTEKEYKAQFEFLKEADAFALQHARRNLESAYTNFYKSLKGQRRGENMGFPRFKSKKVHHESYKTGMAIVADLDGQSIKLPKIAELVKFKHRFNIKSWYRGAKLKNITVSVTPSGKYYASCLFEGEQDWTDQAVKPEKVIGLDMSLQNFYVDSLGNSPEYKRIYRESEEKLALLRRRLTRKPNGSRNREKARIKVARIHERIANYRHNFVDTLSHRLMQEYDAVVVENLSLKGMAGALNLGKSVMDIGYSEFVSRLKYKALWNDKTVILADKWFASSKTCHVCGYVKKDLLLQERRWECPVCHALNERDENAAINLKEYGLKILTRREELTSVDMEALALAVNGSETTVERPARGRSRNLGGRPSSPCMNAGVS
jgi:putative transposase